MLSDILRRVKGAGSGVIEGFIEEIGGGGELFLAELGIDVEGCGELFMTEDLLDGFWVEVGFESDSGKAMAELVGCGGDACFFLITIIESDEAAVGERCLAIVAYYIVGGGFVGELEQFVTEWKEEGDDTVTCFGLGCFNNGAVAVMGDGFGDVDVIFLEIDIFPLEGEDLALSHACHEGEIREYPAIYIVFDDLLVRAACGVTLGFWQIRGGLDAGAWI